MPYDYYGNYVTIDGGGGSIVIDQELSNKSPNPVQNKVITNALGDKVDKVQGKVLSSNDFTTAEKTKLDALGIFENSGALEGFTTLTVYNSVAESADEYILVNLVGLQNAGAQMDTALAQKADKTVATTTADGLMSAADKATLDAVAADYSAALTALGVS